MANTSLNSLYHVVVDQAAETVRKVFSTAAALAVLGIAALAAALAVLWAVTLVAAPVLDEVARTCYSYAVGLTWFPPLDVPCHYHINS
jgi:hypothetical protein